MRYLLRRFFSVFLIFLILLSLSVPCYAADTGLVDVVKTLGQWAVDTLTNGGEFLKTTIFGSDDPDAAYDTYVSDLPATGFSSGNALIWYPALTSVTCGSVLLDISHTETRPFSCSFKSDGVTGDSDATRQYRFAFDLTFPLTGHYTRVTQVSTLANTSFQSTLGGWSPSGNDYAVGETDTARYGFYCNKYQKVNCSGSFDFYFKVIPTSSAILDNYPTDTRIGSLSGNFGYYGDDGELIAVENVHIVNETDSSVYNPVTNTTTNITDWNYDYSTRTYTVTLDNGTTQTITYGDEYVTIHEGDTIYNVYYIGSGSGGGGTDPDNPDACEHTYTSTVTTEATCTAPGLRTYTCSKCNNTYTEKIPATGHTWVVDRTVQTSYDDAGTLLQQGYTIYKCSVCSEEYKDTDGRGPPGSGGSSDDGEKSIWDKLGELIGSVAGGFISIIEGALTKILDYLISLVDAINGKIKSVVDSIFDLFDRIPQLFSGFTALLVAVFPFMPQEFFDILVFAVLVITFAAIIRFLWKR